MFNRFYTLKNFLFVLALAAFSGCFSYHSISLEDYKQDKEHNSIKLLLKSGEEINISEKDSVQLLVDNEKILLSKKWDEKIIYINDIEKIKEEKFDFLKTCFGISWVLFITILIAVWVSPPMKF